MKKILYVFGSALLFTSSTLTPSLLSYQNQKIETYQIIKNEQESREILDFDKWLWEASKSAVKLFVPGFENKITSIDASSLSYTNLEVRQNGNHVRENDPYGFFFGEGILVNDSDDSQLMNTTIFEKAVENSMSYAVTYGFSNAIKGKFMFLENELTFSYNETKTETKTTKKTSKSPAQTFTIPPHSKWKITTFLGKDTTKVNVILNADISGDIKIKLDNSATNPEMTIPIHVAFGTLDKLPKGISLNPSQQKVNFQGAGYATSVEEIIFFQ